MFDATSHARAIGGIDKNTVGFESGLIDATPMRNLLLAREQYRILTPQPK
jgi:hypothetical protein